MKLWKWLKAIQRKVDLTPKLVDIASNSARRKKFSIFMFFLFILIGFFGLFLPFVQGWLVIILAFTFLPFKWLNDLVRNNRKGIENFGTFMFLVSVGFFMYSTAAWGLGYQENSPLHQATSFIQIGKEQFVSYNIAVFGEGYLSIQNSLSIVNVAKQGYAIIAG